MLAESIHSVADTTNEGLLLLGRRRSVHVATAEHPFGFGAERYFWSFVVVVMLFTVGSAFSLVEVSPRSGRDVELTVDLGDVDDFEVGVEAEDPHRKATTLNSHQGPPISRVSTTARLARPLGITKEVLHGHLGARPPLHCDEPHS